MRCVYLALRTRKVLCGSFYAPYIIHFHSFIVVGSDDVCNNIVLRFSFIHSFVVVASDDVYNRYYVDLFID